jgi:predicted acylesterase/phospholipase RssA
MVEKLSAEESQYDVISGVSVGSLTAFFMSTYEKGDEKEMSSKLLDMWKTMTRDKVYHNWSLWYFGIA